MEEDECGICLEAMTREGVDVGGRPESCANHWFHARCLIEWSSICAKCPLCKSPFESVIYVDGTKHVVEEQTSLVEEEEEEVCSICQCTGEVLICDGCECLAHPACVGLSAIPDGEWYCPTCAEARRRERERRERRLATAPPKAWRRTVRRAARDAARSWRAMEKDDDDDETSLEMFAQSYLGGTERPSTMPASTSPSLKAREKMRLRLRTREAARRLEKALRDDEERAKRGWLTFHVRGELRGLSGDVIRALAASPLAVRFMSSEIPSADSATFAKLLARHCDPSVVKNVLAKRSRLSKRSLPSSCARDSPQRDEKRRAQSEDALKSTISPRPPKNKAKQMLLGLMMS